MQPNPRLKNVYEFLRTQNVKNFPKSYGEFEVKMGSDQSLSGNVYTYLKSHNVKNLPDTYDGFYESVGLKKKEPTGQSSTSTLQTGGESSLPDQGNTVALSPEQQEAFRNLGKEKPSTMFTDKQEQLLKEKTVGKQVEGFIPNVTEDLSQIPPSFNKGVISVASAIPKTAAIVGKQLDELVGDDRPIESYPTYQAGKWLEDKALEVGITATNPDREGFLNATVPQAFGQVVGMLLTGGSSSTVAKGATVKEVAKTLTSAPAISGALQVAVPEYEAAKAAGMDDGEAFGVFLKNIPGGLTEVVPIMTGLSRINKITGGGIVNTFKTLSVNGLEEAVQETVQQYYSNVIADESYDPGRDPMNGVLEGAGAGFFVGFVLPGLMGAMQNAKPSQKSKIREYLNQKLKDIKEQPIQTDEVQGDVGKAFQETVEKTVESPVEGTAYSAVDDSNKSGEIYLADSNLAEAYSDDTRTVKKFNYKLTNPLVVNNDADFELVDGLINEYQGQNPGASFHPETTSYVHSKLKEAGYDGLIINESSLKSEEGYNKIGGTYGEPQIVVFDRKNVTEQGQKDGENALVEDMRAQDDTAGKEQSEITEEELTDMVGQIEPVERGKTTLTETDATSILQEFGSRGEKISGEEMFNLLESLPEGAVVQSDEDSRTVIGKKKVKNGREEYELIPQVKNENGEWEDNPSGIQLVTKKKDGTFNVNADLTGDFKPFAYTNDNGDRVIQQPKVTFPTQDAENISQEPNNPELSATEPITQEQDVQETVQTETKDDTLPQSEEVEFDWLGTTKKGKIISEEDGKYKIKGTDGTIFRVKKSDVKNGSDLPNQTQQQPNKPKTKKRVITQAQQEEPSDSGVSKEVGEGVVINDKAKPKTYTLEEDEKSPSFKDMTSPSKVDTTYGLDLFVFKNNKTNRYNVIDAITGRSLGEGKTKKEAIQEFNDLENWRLIFNDNHYIKEIINKYIDKGDVSDRYKGGRYSEKNPLSVKERIKLAEDEVLPKLSKKVDEAKQNQKSRNLGIIGATTSETFEEKRYKSLQKKVNELKESLREPVKETNEAVGFVQPSGLNFSMPFDISAVTDGAKRWVKKYFTSSGLLPESAFGIANKAEQNKTAALKKAKFLVSDLEKAIKKDFKNPDYPLINQVLKGEKPYTDLPPATAKAVEVLRNHVTQVQDELIDSGAVQGDLAIAIDESKGTYLTRSYKVHDDPEGYTKWLEDNPEGQRIKNRAIGFIREKFPNATKEEIDGIINELLYKPDAPVAILKGGKLGSKDLGVLTKRKDIAPEIRALLGEYDNPIVNYSKSVLKMSNLIANHKLQSEIRKDGMGKYFFEKPTGKYFVKIAPSGSTTMDALTEGKDLYTSEDVAEAINEWNQKDLTPELLSWLYKLNGLASYSKTVLSTSTHARNLVGSGIIAIANGHVFDGAGKFNEAVKSTVTSLANGTDAKVREKLLDYAKLGIIGDSHQAGYLKDLIKDINKSATDPSMLLNNRYRKFVNKSLESINAAYQAEDDLFKIFAFENEVSRYSKAYAEDLKSGKMTENDIRLKAAEVVRATFPTYSLSPKGIKALRRLPFISSFPTFPAEMIRTTWNNAALTKKELADPKTRSIGVKRLAGMMTAMGMTYAMTEFMKQAYGIFDDEDDALDKFVAPWAKNGHRVHLRGKENGTYRYVDLSYSDPYSMFKRPVETLLSDGDLLDNAKESARMVMEPFISEGMLTKRVREIASNVDENKRTIYNPEAPIGDQLNDIYAHLASSVEPGTVRSLKRISGALKGESGNDYGKEFSIADELIFMGLGQRIETLDPPQALYFKTREIGKRLTDAKDIFDNVKYKYSRGKATEDELKKALKTSEEVSNKIKSELLEVIDAANRLGIDQRVIIDNVNKNIGKKDTF